MKCRPVKHPHSAHKPNNQESHKLSVEAFVESHPSRKKRDEDGAPIVQQVTTSQSRPTATFS